MTSSTRVAQILDEIETIVRQIRLGIPGVRLSVSHGGAADFELRALLESKQPAAEPEPA